MVGFTSWVMSRSCSNLYRETAWWVNVIVRVSWTVLECYKLVKHSVVWGQSCLHSGGDMLSPRSLALEVS